MGYFIGLRNQGFSLIRSKFAKRDCFSNLGASMDVRFGREWVGPDPETEVYDAFQSTPRQIPLQWMLSDIPRSK